MGKDELGKGNDLVDDLIKLIEQINKKNEILAIVEKQENRKLIVETLSLSSRKQKNKKEKIIILIDSYVEGILTNSSCEFLLTLLMSGTTAIMGAYLGIIASQMFEVAVSIYIAVGASIVFILIIAVVVFLLPIKFYNAKRKINRCMFYLLLLSKSLKDLGD